MREIKFRAWDTRLEEMTYCDPLHIGDYLCDRDNVMMQYTGLKDKNGKEIYENDIVTKQGKKPTVITLEKNESSDGGIVMGFAMPSAFVYDMEVIGNIYQNPELLQHDA